MKLVELKEQDRRWDKWRSFYWNFYGYSYHEHGARMVVFDTREIISEKFKWDPDQRRTYEDFGITVVGTNDPKCPVFQTPDGEVVKKTWLNDKGAQIMWIDHRHNMVVRISPPGGKPKWHQNIPVRFRSKATIYYAGWDQEPQGEGIVINRPRKLADHEKEHLRQMKLACTAFFAMEGDHDEVLRSKWNLHKDHSVITGEWLLKQNFDDLTYGHRMRLHFAGYLAPMERLVFPYLTVARDKNAERSKV